MRKRALKSENSIILTVSLIVLFIAVFSTLIFSGCSRNKEKSDSSTSSLHFTQQQTGENISFSSDVIEEFSTEALFDEITSGESTNKHEASSKEESTTIKLKPTTTKKKTTTEKATTAKKQSTTATTWQDFGDMPEPTKSNNATTVREAYEEFLISYEFYVDWRMPTEDDILYEDHKYAFVDIDQDGVEEMVLDAKIIHGVGWSHAVIYSCDPDTLEVCPETDKIYHFAELGYSPKNKALTYRPEKGTVFYAENILIKKDGGKYREYASLYWEREDSEEEYEYYYTEWDKNENVIVQKELGTVDSILDDKEFLDYRYLDDMLADL